VPFTNEQLATAIEQVSERFFVINDDDLISNRVLRRLFENLTEDIRGERPLGTTFSALAKLAGEFDTVTSSMGHIPKRLAMRLGGNRVRTAIDGVVVDFEFFGPDAKHRRSSGTAGYDKRLYLEFHHEAQTPSIPADDPVLEAARAEQAQATRASSQLLSQVIELQSIISEQVSQAQPPRSPRQLPQPPRDFKGRDVELREILDAIRAEKFTIVGLQGPGGIGKTALGLALAEHLAPEYVSSIFVDLNGNTQQPLTPAEVMRHVIRAYLPGRSIPDSPAELGGLYNSLLNADPALLFFDNALDAAQVQPLIPPRKSFLLLTSVRRFTLPGMYRKQIEPLEADAARAMLIAIAPRCGPEADGIAMLCNCFPLALRAAGHALAELPGISASTYAERLRDTRRRLELVDPTTERSVEAALDLLYALMPQPLQAHFDSLSVFPATFDCAAAGAVWRLPRDSAQDALATLVKFSFVEYDDADDRYHLHDLLRAFADSHVLPSVRPVLEHRFARHFRSVVYSQPWRAEGNSTSAETMRRLLLDWPNIASTRDWATAHAATSKPAARLLVTLPFTNANELPMSRRDAIRWIASGTGLSDSRRQRIYAGLNLTRQALLHAYSGEFGPALAALARLPNYIKRLGDLPTTSFILLTLQLIAGEVPDLRSDILSFLLPLAASRHESIEQLHVFTAVGRIYSGMERYDDAFAYFDLALQMSSVVASTLNVLPTLLTLACDAALKCHKEDQAATYVDQLMRVAADDTDRSTTILFGLLATAYAKVGDFDRGEQLYQLYAERSRQPTFGGTDPRRLANEAKTWYSFSYFGIYHGRRANNCEAHAIELLSEALRISRERMDEINEKHASTVLGLIYALRKDFTRAMKLLPRGVYQKIVRGNAATAAVALAEIFGDYYG
jgi:tetratricopeptide (TPR) repeat protein